MSLHSSDSEFPLRCGFQYSNPYPKFRIRISKSRKKIIKNLKKYISDIRKLSGYPKIIRISENYPDIRKIIRKKNLDFNLRIPLGLSTQVPVNLIKHKMSETNDANPMPSKEQEEAVIKKKYGGLLPKKNPLISKDHDRAFFDSADWALGKVTNCSLYICRL
ncbi:hypothetical protein R6Q59_012039 [Mikania micrantha]